MSDNDGDRAAEIDEEEQTEEVDAVAMEAICQALLETTLEIGDLGDVNRIFENGRYFVKMSKGNDTVQNLVLYLHFDYERDYETLRVLGEGFGNLRALRVLTVRYLTVHGRHHERTNDDNDDPEVAGSLYWQAFADALGRVHQHIELRLDGDSWEFFQNFTALTAALQGASTIQTFHSGHTVPWFQLNRLIPALASLPSLENVTLGSLGDDTPYRDVPELTNLLKSPSLRSVEFSRMFIASQQSQALHTAFEEGSLVTNLRFTNCFTWSEYHELEQQIGTLLGALVPILQRNSLVKTLSVIGNDFDELFIPMITSALLVNTTLVDLTLRTEAVEEGGRWLQNLFVAMRINTSLKCLDVNDFHFTDELVCRALRDMLEKNSVLESLTLRSPENLDETGVISWRRSDRDNPWTLHHPESPDEASVVSWRKILPFIRDNTTLKSLTISINGDGLDPHVATICFDTVAMLEGNTTLECLEIKSGGISQNTYCVALDSLKPNSTLTTLRLSPVLALMALEETKQMVSLLKKNYSLEVLDNDVSAHDKTGEVGIILRLNKMGRRYLIKDAASVAKGVEVLIGVRDDLGCLFYHLLENPTLCDVEHQYSTKSGTAGNCAAHLNKRQRIQS
jgi:hypothetical protein